MSQQQQKYSWPKNVPKPRDARQVLTPFAKSNVRIVSDVIPTQCVTSTYPEVDVTTYGNLLDGNIMYADGNAMEFSAYVIRKMEPDSKPGFTRCWFSQHISLVDPVTGQLDLSNPYLTESEYGDWLWHSILLRVDFLVDASFPITTRSRGNEISAPRYYPRVFHIPEATEGTLFKDKHYIQSMPFNIPQFEAPQPSDVSFSYLNCEGRWPRCLHGKLLFDTKQTAIVAYNASVGDVVASGSIAGQFFPETNFEDWQTYNISAKQTEVSGALYRLTIRSATPPIPSEVAIATT